MVTYDVIKHQEVLKRALESKQDPHKSVASWLLDLPYESITMEQRNSIKSINFGLLYNPMFLETVNWPKD